MPLYPVHGPDARPFLEVEALHEAAGGGVRPSSGAATLQVKMVIEGSSALACARVAAPEDGRTPTRFRLSVFVYPKVDDERRT